MDYLDSKTIFVLSTIFSVLMTGVLFSIYRGMATFSLKGVLSLTVAYACYSLFAILLLLRGYLPDFFSIFIADCALSTSVLLIYDGLSQLKKWPVNKLFYIAFFGAVVLSYGFFTFLSPSFQGRVLISMLSIIIIFGSGLIRLVLHNKFKWLLGDLLVSMAFLAASTAALILIIDMLYVGLSIRLTSIFAYQGTQAFSLVVNLLAVVFIAQGLIVIIYDVIRGDLEQFASYDALTGVYTRRVILNILEKSAAKVTRTGQPLALMIIDLDHFKRINDHFGHRTGDVVLSTIIGVIDGALRKDTYIGRYGGEEFLAVMPDTNAYQLREVCERIRQVTENTRIPCQNKEITCTVSIGALLIDNSNVDQVTDPVAIADKALYRAKQQGRNRVVIFDQQTVSLAEQG